MAFEAVERLVGNEVERFQCFISGGILCPTATPMPVIETIFVRILKVRQQPQDKTEGEEEEEVECVSPPPPPPLLLSPPPPLYVRPPDPVRNECLLETFGCEGKEEDADKDVFAEQVDALKAMGFGTERAQQALQATGGNVEEAMVFLLEQH